MTDEHGPDEVFVLPASFGQERLWLMDRVGAGAAYHISGAVRLRGHLDVTAMARALTAVVRRHEILRTTFEFGLDGQLVQVIHQEPRMTLAERDISAAPPQHRDAALSRILREQDEMPFSLATGPLLRATAVRTGEADWAFGITVHHIVADGWSIGILLAELARGYRAEPGACVLPELSIQYGDWAAWQREQADPDGPDDAYWAGQLGGVPPAVPPAVLPVSGRAAVTESWQSGTVPIVIPAELRRRLRALGGQEQATMFMVLLTGLALLLGRWTGQDDVVIGTPVAGRDRAEVQDLIGFFVNTLPLRISWTAGETVRSVLRKARQVCIDGYAHQSVPFERIVELAKAPRSSRFPLIQAMIVLDTAAAPALDLAGVTAEPIQIPVQHAHVDLAFHLSDGPDGPDGEMAGSLVFAVGAWQQEQAASLAGAWHAVLTAMTAEPDLPASRVPLLSAAERIRLSRDFPCCAAEPLAAGPAHERFEAHSRERPEAIAVEAAGQALSYRQLGDLADVLAARLRAEGTRLDQLVGVCAGDAVGQVVALLAVLKAGAGYLLLDPAYPATQWDLLRADGRPDLILADAATVGWAAGAARVMRADEPGLPASPAAARNPPPRPGPLNLASVLPVTQGSGQPGCPVQTHLAMSGVVAALQQEFGLGTGEAVVSLTPLSAGAGAPDWLWPLSAGARLILAGPGAWPGRDQLAGVAGGRCVVTCHAGPAELDAFLASPEAAGCASLIRRVLCPGELSPELIRRFAGVLPGAELCQGYGRAGELAWQRILPGYHALDEVPVTRPLTGVRALVVGADGEVVPVGMPGELYLGGPTVSRGYHRRPALTAQHFVPDPAVAGGRMHRTGDRVRWRGDGTLEILDVGQPGWRLARAAAPPVAQGTPAEQMLTEIWAAVLDIEKVGVGDEFYELGGDSLRAITVFQQAQDRGLLLPLRRMLTEHTISELLDWLRDNPEAALEQLSEIGG